MHGFLRFMGKYQRGNMIRGEPKVEGQKYQVPRNRDFYVLIMLEMNVAGAREQW